MWEYLKIRLHEADRTSLFGPAAYRKLVHYLWESGAPGVTVFRSREGLGKDGRLQDIFSDYIGDNLPITLDIVGKQQEIHRICERLDEYLPDKSAALLFADVTNVKEEGWKDLQMQAGAILKVYMKADDEFEGKPLYHALVLACKDLNLEWVDVQEALEGFGEDHVIRRTKFFEFASHSLVLFEAAFPSTRMDEIMTALKPLLRMASGPAILLTGLTINVKHHAGTAQ